MVGLGCLAQCLALRELGKIAAELTTNSCAKDLTGEAGRSQVLRTSRDQGPSLWACGLVGHCLCVIIFLSLLAHRHL